MAEMSTYLENAVINAVLRNTSYSSPAVVYVGLHTANPTDAGSGAEVSGNGYVRKSAFLIFSPSGAFGFQILFPSLVCPSLASKSNITP